MNKPVPNFKEIVESTVNAHQNKKIEDTLDQRGRDYGDFNEHARITQNIKDAMKDSPNWDKLSPHMKEALEMDAHKTARILNGNPYLYDSWHDKEGYTRLVSRTLNPNGKTQVSSEENS